MLTKRQSRMRIRKRQKKTISDTRLNSAMVNTSTSVKAPPARWLRKTA